MTDRKVTVRLAMTARDYIAEALAADAATRRLAASQKQLGMESSSMGDKMTRAGQLGGRSLLYTAAGLAAVGGAGGALKALPPLLTATAVGASALPGVLGATAATAITAKVALSGVGDALGEVLKQDDPFARLAPNARAFVAEMGASRPVLRGFQQDVQNLAMRGTAADLRMLTTEVLPQVQQGVNRLAADWADAFAEITLAASDPASIDALNTLSASADRFFDRVNTRIRPTAKSISTLVTAADPVVEAIGIKMVGAIDRFNAKVAQAKESGRLDQFFAAGAVAARELADITGDIVHLTGQVISAAQRENTALGQASDRLDAYINSGRSAQDIAGIVHTLTEAYEGLAMVLGPIAGLVRDAFADPGTAQSFKIFFQTIALGTQTLVGLLRILLELNNVFQGVPLALIALAVAAQKVSVAVNAVTTATTRGAAALAGYGAAGATAGKGLTAFGAGVGRLIPVLFALEAAHQLIDFFQDDTVHVDKLDTAVKRFAQDGKVSGEMARLFGDNLNDMGKQAAYAGGQDPFAKIIRSAEKIPGIGGIAQDIAQLFGSDTFTGSKENFEGLDASLVHLAESTGDAKVVGDAFLDVQKKTGLGIEDLNRLLPGTAAELTRLQNAAHAAENGMGDNSERAKLLAGSFHEASLAGKDLAATFDIINGKSLSALQAEVNLEAAYDNAEEVISRNGKTVKRGTHELDTSTKAGRENAEALSAIATNGAAAADAINKKAGNDRAGIPVLREARKEFIEQATAALGSKEAAEQLADAIFKIPDKDIEISVADAKAIEAIEALGFKVKRLPDGTFAIDADDKDAQHKLHDLGFTVRHMPDGTFKIIANDADSKAKLAAAEAQIAAMNGRTVTINLKVRQLTADVTSAAESAYEATKRQIRGNRDGGVYVPRQRGGVRAAQDGLLEAKIAPPGTLYQWAEPATGGEAFVPKNGDRQRGRDILEVAASWYDMAVVPMLRGGIRAAASGLVNFAPRQADAVGATRLDFADSYVRARQAVRSLSEALRENGRSFSANTAKGLENRSAVYGVIRAAQDAAKTKFDETGNVKAANQAYDEHIRRLRAVLAQQKVNSDTIRGLLALAQRPTFDAAAIAPANSAGRIAAVRSQIGAADQLAELRDALSLNLPTATLATPEGRQNLGGILDFLEQAAEAAQDQFNLSGNARTAKNLYNGYVRQLRRTLSQSGYSKTQIDSLLNAYGRITLTPNLRGGVYMAAAGAVSLREPALYAAGERPLYGFAEKATGGELFLPRHGDVARGRDLAEVGAGWYGGRVTWPGQGGAGGGTVEHHTHLNVYPRTLDLSLSTLDGYVRQLDQMHRTGLRR